MSEGPTASQDAGKAPSENGFPSREARATRTQHGLVLVRLIVATLVLGGTLALTAEQGDYASFTPRSLIVLIIITYAVSAAFAVALAASKGGTPRWIAPAQLTMDLVITTGLVYLSGAAGSVLTTLYGITILAAAFTGFPTAPLRVAVAALALYLVVGLGVALGAFPGPPDQDSIHYLLDGPALLFAVFSNLFGLLLVAALSVGLATRLARTGGQLARVEALNDDIVRSIAAGLVTVATDGLVRSVNPSGAVLLGASPDELVGARVSDLFDVGDGQDERRGEGRALPRDREPFPIGFNRAPLLAGGGSLLVFTDLTEIRTLELAAERAERLASLGRLAAALAHEIRNPLGSISGSVQLVRDSSALPDEDRDLLGMVLREVNRLNGLVTQMLDVGRPAALHLDATDLRDLVDDVAALFRADDALSHVEVRVQGKTGRADLDAAKMRQVVWNLLKNAAQASPEGGAIDVQVSGTDVGLTLRIRDEGPGVPEEELGRLFDMFFSGGERGIGLGLAVVKQVIDAHQGRIEVRNHPEGGALFEIVLPRHTRPSLDSGSRRLHENSSDLSIGAGE